MNTYELGARDGERWATKLAKPAELRRLDKLRNVNPSDMNRMLYDSLSAYPIDQQIADLLEGRSGGNEDYDACEDFWAQFRRDEGTSSDPDYLRGFIEGALSVAVA